MSDFSKYANSFQAVPRLGLERITHLMALLGRPDRAVKCIHIAGTNGKGSVAAFLSSVLTAAGYRTGLYISPNLVKVNERISIDGTVISDADLEVLLARVRAAAEQTKQDMGELPSQFEIWTAAAFLYFADSAVDYLVLETGLGGEFDATNVIESNELAVLTHIDLDHTALLGNTVAEIATTKCGILKSDCTTGKVIASPGHSEALSVISAKAKEKGLTPIFSEPPAPHRFSGFGEIISYRGISDIHLPLCGVHQISNACTAIDAALALGVAAEHIKTGVEQAKNPARMELLRPAPVLLYDGGHNPDGISALLTSIRRYTPNVKYTVIFTAMSDKDIKPSLVMLSEISDRFIFTTVLDNPRAYDPEGLCAEAGRQGIIGTPAPDLAAAIELAGAAPTLICGSLYLYADLPAELRAV